MNYYNRKCKGCGLYFSNEKNSPSYVKNLNEDTKYCIRCFKLKHYHNINNEFVDENNIAKVLNELDVKDNLVLMVLDLFDLKNSLINEFKNNENIVFLVNKLNCLPNKFNINLSLEKIKNLIIEEGFYVRKVIFYDSYENKNISSIVNIIKKNHLEKKITYIVGKTNAGKSSLINSLLKKNKLKPDLSVSPFPNTTLNLSKVKIDDLTIIDTPGYKNDNISNSLSNEDILLINKNHRFIYKNFVIKENNQIFFIENLFYIKPFDISEKANICFYINSIFQIHRTKDINKEKCIENNNNIFKFSLNKKTIFKEKIISLDKNKKYNIFVSGISLISIKGINEICIGFPDDKDIFCTDNAII